MQFALVNQVRSHAQKGLEGVCELCNSKVIAKCGSIVVHHWSHYNRKECDKWWEPETSVQSSHKPNIGYSLHYLLS